MCLCRRSFSLCINNKAVCKILNHNPYVVTFKRGMKLAKVLGLDKIAAVQKCEDVEGSINVEPESSVSRIELNSFHKSFGFQISPSLNEAQKYELLLQLYCHRSVFALDVIEIKECKAPSLTLELHTDRKMFKRQYRLNEEDRVEVARQIKEMEDVGVIETPDMPYYNSPIFLVMKNNGSKRLLVDLRGISSLGPHFRNFLRFFLTSS